VNCPSRPNSTATCAGGSCSFTCTAGKVDCNLQAVDGCESTLATDPNNCGKCNNVCASGKCFAGSCKPKCADLVTNANMWGQGASGLALGDFTNGTLDWIGCNGNGCAANSFFCTDEPNGIFFGTTSGSALRSLVDPGNAAGTTFPTTGSVCCSAGQPRQICNAPRADNNGVGGFNSGDAICKALGYATGVVVLGGAGNFCPRPNTTTANGSNWANDWNPTDGNYGAQFRCSTP
jgi:hypothetical protein